MAMKCNMVVRNSCVKIKVLREYLTGKEVLAVFEEARVESVFSVGIWLEAVLKDLTVFQTCLHPCLETFLKYYMYLFHFLRIVMTLFLSEVSLLICIHCLFFSFLLWCSCSSRGCCEDVFLHYFHEFVSHISHAESMLGSLYKGFQSVVSVSFFKVSLGIFPSAMFPSFHRRWIPVPF